MKVITISNYYIKACFLMLVSFLFFSIQSNAQCEVSSLNIGTGYYNGSNIAHGQTDPNWWIADKTGDYYTFPLILQRNDENAISVTSAVFNTPGWISDNVTNGTTGITQTQDSRITFRRKFKVCEEADYVFDLDIWNDDYVVDILIDGTTTGYKQDILPGAFINNVWNVGHNATTDFERRLDAGPHTIDIVVESNWSQQQGLPNNLVGLRLAGTISTKSGETYLINDMDAACIDYKCACSELCFWKKEGNTINLGEPNFLGTKTNEDIRIISNKPINVLSGTKDRGIITKDGLLGWNTDPITPGDNSTPLSATAFFHVNCAGNNPDDGSALTSDIRFQNLEPGSGDILAIDANGYIYDTDIPATSSTLDWHVHGNFVMHNPDNVFGTLNDADIRIVSAKNGQTGSGPKILDRGVITREGMFGWNTTVQTFPNLILEDNPLTATARFHIDCKDGNHPTSKQIPGPWSYKSDIRFENLEKNENNETLNILGIASDGYVYDTDVKFSDLDNIYWKLDGNTLTTGQEFLGTNTADHLRFRTDAVNTAGSDPEMVITGANAAFDHGFIGIHTIGLPTARLHVNCNDGNGLNGNGNNESDIRFENLEVKYDHLELLGIDPQGYVYNTTIPLSDINDGLGAVCSIPDMVAKFDANGDLDCSILHDDGVSVGVGATGPYNYNTANSTQYGGPNPISGTGTVTLDVNGVSRSTAFLSTSDAKFKKDIQQITDPFSIINRLNGKNYAWNDYAKNKIKADGGRHYGFIAQEVEKVMPEAVVRDESNTYAVEYNAFIPLLTEGMKDLYKLYEQEKAKNQELEKRLEALEARLNTMETTATPDVKSTETTGNKLYQNTPNPFGNETEIRYEINVMQRSAHIMIYDLNGREIAKYQIDKGEGSIIVSSSKLVPGMYLYSLVIDGRPEDTKRMVFSD